MRVCRGRDRPAHLVVIMRRKTKGRPVWPSWLPFRDHLTWRRETRTIGRDFDLHESVYERFELPVVSQHDRRAPYRPAALATHEKVSRYYSVDGTDRV